ncbi:hypothetical protein HK100_009420 [Physocladia obscura]|uniref:Threonine dehydratase n=1 Tax=Physocladia obscura TaxID=109957 RepID=A0AAD5T4E3_9FUNG|nr:hypothetical protein HK100_009420 [Physocladia obscura]
MERATKRQRTAQVTEPDAIIQNRWKQDSNPHSIRADSLPDLSHPDYLKMILTANVYDVANETPLQHAHNLSNKFKNKILLKREDLQPVFSFKLRGAYNRMQQLTDSEKEAGVVACSAGNHAQGVALAAQTMGIKATIVMPLATPPIKVKNVKRMGAKVVLHGNDFDEAKAECARLTTLHKLTNIPPYDDPYVIAGQGTIAVEILRQVPRHQDVDAIFICCGGGGLTAGIASYIKRVSPHIKIIGVETFDSDAMTKSIIAGKRVQLDEVGLFADGAAVRLVGEETFRICKDLVDEMVLVSTDEICAAIKDIFEDTRSIVEPAGALGIAGMKRYIQDKGVQGKTLIGICSGANMNFDRLRFVADRADFGEQTEALITVSIPERPGSFMELYHTIHPHNVTQFMYRYANPEKATVIMSIKVEDRVNELEVIFANLEAKGFPALDASNNEMAKAHGRFFVGGQIDVPHERVFRFTFPERPGALHHFLTSLNGTTAAQQLSCSLFHYRNYGGDVGKVFVGIQVPPNATKVFDEFMEKLKYPYVEETGNAVYHQIQMKPKSAPVTTSTPKTKTGSRRPKPAQTIIGRNLGGRKKHAVEADIQRGRLISAAAKERREKMRELAKAKEAKDLKDVPKASKRNANNDNSDHTDASDSNEEDDGDDAGSVTKSSSSHPTAPIDGPSLTELQKILAKPKTKGGQGKKGKVFASQTDMLSLINDINSFEEVKIVQKLVKRKAVNEVLDAREARGKAKDKEKRRVLEEKKKEILESQKRKKSDRHKTVEQAEPDGNGGALKKKKTVHFA